MKGVYKGAPGKGSPSRGSWGDRYVIDADSKRHFKRVSCLTCINYCEEDKSCNVTSIIPKVHGHKYWIKCNEFNLSPEYRDSRHIGIVERFKGECYLDNFIKREKEKEAEEEEKRRHPIFDKKDVKKEWKHHISCMKCAYYNTNKATCSANYGLLIEKEYKKAWLECVYFKLALNYDTEKNREAVKNSERAITEVKLDAVRMSIMEKRKRKEEKSKRKKQQTTSYQKDGKWFVVNTFGKK